MSDFDMTYLGLVLVAFLGFAGVLVAAPLADLDSRLPIGSSLR